ncbi:hypothetical protein ACU4HD_01740 [Cupriavidus basilensis]
MEPLNCTMQAELTGKISATASRYGGVAVPDRGPGRYRGACSACRRPRSRSIRMMAGGGFGRRAVPTSDYLVEAAQRPAGLGQDTGHDAARSR